MIIVFTPVTMFPWVKVRVPVAAPARPTVVLMPRLTEPVDLLIVRLRKLVAEVPPIV